MGNAHTMDECKRMKMWLENMLQNMTILSRKFESLANAMDT